MFRYSGLCGSKIVSSFILGLEYLNSVLVLQMCYETTYERLCSSLKREASQMLLMVRFFSSLKNMLITYKALSKESELNITILNFLKTKTGHPFGGGSD